jgi:hypothetical protein
VVALRGARCSKGRRGGAAGRGRHRGRLRRRSRTGRDAGQAAQRARRLPGRGAATGQPAQADTLEARPPADDLHSAWAQLFAAALAQCGVAQAVISPGSRSTPLALALAAQLPGTVLHDERVAAFFALGQARATGRRQRGAGHQRHRAGALAAGGDGGARKPACRCCCSAPTGPGKCSRRRLRRRWTRCGCSATTPTPTSSSACPTRTRPRCAPCRASRRRRCWPRSYPLAGAVQVNAHFRKPLEPQPSDRARALAAALAGADATPARRACCRRSRSRTRTRWRRWWRACAPRRAAWSWPGRLPAPQAAGAGARRCSDLCIAASGYVLLAEATSQLRFGLPICGGHAMHAAPSTRCCGRRPRCARRAAAGAGAGDRRTGGVGAMAGLGRRRRCAGALVLPGERPADPAGGALGMLLGPVAALLDAAAAAAANTPAPAARGCRGGGVSPRPGSAAEDAACRVGGRVGLATAAVAIPTPMRTARTPASSPVRPCLRAAAASTGALRWPGRQFEQFRCATSTTTCRPMRTR